MGTAFVEVNDKEELVNFHIPITTATSPNIVWSYNLKNQGWTRNANEYTAKGQSTRQRGTTIGELQGTIGDQTFKFGDWYVRAGAKTMIYGDTSGQVCLYDKSVYSLAYSGTQSPQEFSYVTPDLVGLPTGGILTRSKVSDPIDKDDIDYTTVQKRWNQITIEMVGNGTADVEYSTDFGNNYSTLPESPVTLSVTGTNHVLDLDVTSRQIRFRVSNAATNAWCGVKYVKVEFIPGSEQ